MPTRSSGGCGAVQGARAPSLWMRFVAIDKSETEALPRGVYAREGPVPGALEKMRVDMIEDGFGIAFVKSTCGGGEGGTRGSNQRMGMKVAFDTNTQLKPSTSAVNRLDGYDGRVARGLSGGPSLYVSHPPPPPPPPPPPHPPPPPPPFPPASASFSVLPGGRFAAVVGGGGGRNGSYGGGLLSRQLGGGGILLQGMSLTATQAAELGRVRNTAGWAGVGGPKLGVEGLGGSLKSSPVSSSTTSIDGKRGEVAGSRPVAAAAALAAAAVTTGAATSTSGDGMRQQQQPFHQLNAPQTVRRSQIGALGELVAGGIAGAFSKTCTAPLARLTILFQVQGMQNPKMWAHRPTLWQEIVRIRREEGIRAFWKGNTVTIVHRLPYSSLNFYTYEKYKSFLVKTLGKDSRDHSLGVGMGLRLLAGGGAGITAASITYPLDLVRTRLAAQTKEMYYRGISHALTTIVKEEGLRGLYKGMGATLLQVGPSIAINFSVYETLKNLWSAHYVSKRSDTPAGPPVTVSLACGCLSGIASSTATFPLDLVRRRMQLEGAAGRAQVYDSGIIGTFSKIIRSEGFRGLYRGIIPEYYKVIPGVGIAWMTYECMKRLLKPPRLKD